MTKKVFAICALMLYVCAICKAESLPLDSVVSIANRFLSVNAASWQVDLKKNQGLMRSPSRDGSSPAYYIFKGSGNRGFVIVSADDAARPILGYSFDATLPETDELPLGMQDWLDDMEQQIRTAREDGANTEANLPQEAEDPTVGNICVKLETAQWGQGSPFNSNCPMFNEEQCITGCVPTAYAILMKYYGYPTAGRGVTPSYTTEENSIDVASRDLNHYYDWSLMPLKYEVGQYTAKEAMEVSTLLADIGAALQVDYGVDETSGYMGRIPLYTYFDYNPGTKESKDSYSIMTWYAKLQAELDQQRPVVYRADNAEGGGHAFLIDGYTDNNYFSVNWGWSGSYNGFYALSAFQPGTRDYNSNQSAFFECVPMPVCQTIATVDMNGTKFPTLKIAFAAAPSDGTQSVITLTEDISSDYVEIEEGKDIVLDLNGKELSLNGEIEIRGSLCISAQNGGRITNVDGNQEILGNYGKLTILSGTFENLVNPDGINYSRCIWSADGSTTTIHGGTFSAFGQVVCFNGEATIMGGDFTNTGDNTVVACSGPVKILGGTYKSQYYAIYMYDDNYDLTIEGGTFTTSGNISVITNYNPSGNLIIRDGTFKNIAPSPSDSDYRRAVWTADGTNTIIEGGSFSAPRHALCFNGEATILDGEFINTNGSAVIGCSGPGQILGGTFESEGNVVCVFDDNCDLTIKGGTFLSYGNSSVVYNYNTSGNLIIDGGTFKNIASTPSGSDYRRAVWTDEGTNTIIKNGIFYSTKQVLCFNGNATIEDGDFTTSGNSSVVSNYNTSGNLIIRRGIFTNIAASPSSGYDYRRAVWTDEGSNTIIEGGTFNSPSQVLCFNGDATIYDATITNTGNGYGILAFSNSLVSIINCKLKAPYLMYADTEDDSRIACEGGLFSKMVGIEYLRGEYECIENTDPDTSEEYPYIVVRMDETGVTSVSGNTPEWSPSYNLNGQRVNDNAPGLIIQNGRKQLRKK